jgi:hypothetical protein
METDGGRGRAQIARVVLSHMAKSSKIEPVNIDLYEKAWGHRPQPQIKKQSRSKKKSGRKRKTKK